MRQSLSAWKPRIVKWLLAFVAVLGIAAEIIEPLGKVLKGQGFLGGSFAALIALILLDAVGDSDPQEVSGVYVLADLGDLRTPMAEAFEARVVSIDFSGFSMQTLLGLLMEPLNRLGDEKVNIQELTLRLTIAHLNLPLSLPGKLEPAESADHPDGTLHFMDSEENRERMREKYTLHNWNELKRLLERVHEKNPNIAISCEVRESPQVPERKLYIFNHEKVFSAPYGIRESSVEWRGNSFRILDTEGFGFKYGNARIIGWDRRSRSRSTQEIAEHHMEWHRNLWERLKYIKPRHPVIADPRWVRPDEQSQA
ncbi:hypothetical protein [Streptomyces sp. NL15-2K]|uniref:hypothetical protein n=1 Tax=Streptomyces sp. NL15-2K TaxID=376149 RepID=UPI000F57FC42|nr:MULTISPECIES: hypothetical protein [Actinomycetes]WKX10374.1 hypothetical protein Q4V64_23850 [Kutzneria buriramensis]GCB48122.1 hypothetical protein SNL152K_5445 [Streptomyces sp. NL15-2K]